MATELKHTVMPSGGDFTTVKACVDHLKAVHSDLVATDNYAIVEVSGNWTGVAAESETINFTDTLITSADCYVLIHAIGDARHAGVWSANKHRMSVPNSKVFDWYSGNPFARIDGLQVETPSTNGTADYPILIRAGGTAWISNCIVRGNPTEAANYQHGISNTGTLYLWNTVIYNISQLASSRCLSTSTGAAYVYSVTGIGGSYGFNRASGTATAKNCYFGGSAAGDYNGTITKTTCASSDATGSAGLTGITVSTQADATHAGFTNITAGTENFHIVSGSPLIGVGTDTSGDAAPMNFTTDIDGETRS